ncbi:MAG: hypothetical protein P8P26_03125 [Porticoccaceae bacterium]|nr:hypothetical protein [Porticoccaceae bacterium]MDG1311036.1 hypothetical protein [Porticoccaceae bacterium]
MDNYTMQRSILIRDIQAFYDELYEFSRDCAFLSDEFTELANKEKYHADSTAAGLTTFSQWVKSRTVKLNETMREIKIKSDNMSSQH